ncbi:DUF397 domain-containing protein [Streptomyces flavofungini]|uniref:DUF397 domain-containing protein n=1 Tax=Streptomyces flavofungini TaxID=68200 RepID=UPI003F7FBBAE
MVSAEGGAELTWRKSSYSSNGSEGDCVEVAHASGRVHVRDSKEVLGPQLAVTESAWANFVPYACGS